MSAIELVVFDLDGTIIDSEWAHEAAKRNIMQAHEMLVGIDMKYYTGRSNRVFWEAVLRRSGRREDPDFLVKEQFKHVIKYLTDANQRESAGLTELLTYLKDNGYKAAVCSGSEDYFVRGILKLLGVEPFFDVVVTGADAKELKPAPDIYLAALRKSDVSADRAVAIEDSRSGCMAVHAAGMRSIGYTANGTNPQDLSNADHQVRSLVEVIDWLKGAEGTGITGNEGYGLGGPET